MKNIKWRDFLMNHGEKIVLGLAGFLLLTCLSMTSWGTYSRTPEEFKKQVTTEKQNFEASRWLPAEKKPFEEQPSPLEKVAVVTGGVDNSPLYQLGCRFVWPINKRKERLREPKLYGVQTLVADAGRMLGELALETPGGNGLIVKTEDQVGAEAVGASKPKVEGPRVDGPRVDGPRTNGLPTSPMGHGATADAGASLLPGPAAGAHIAGADPGMMMHGSPGMMGGSGYARPKRTDIEARGLWFAAIRGVIPMKRQIDEYQRALALDTIQEAALEINYWDFKLERKTAVAGADPWGGAWEPVDVDLAISLLKRMDFDSDIVPEQYRDTVFTTPLPYRVTGSWDNAYPLDGGDRLLASHPQIRQLLSEKQREEEEAKNSALIEAAKKTQQVKETSKRGLSGIQHDTRSMRGMIGKNAEFTSEVTNMYNSMMAGGGHDAVPGMPMGSSMPMDYAMQGSGAAFGRLQVVATPELLLFRFFDFSVVPGNAYRYRVMVTVKNPLFGKDPAELVDVASREVEFRETGWSEESNPVFVRDDANVFVTRVDERKGANIDAFQWLTETGSHVMGQLEGVHRGEKVAKWTKEVTKRNETTTEGGVEADVLRPSDQTYMKERIDYVTPNTVVDYSRRTLMPLDEFPDLNVTVRPNIVSINQVVMTNRFGELFSVDSVDQAPSYKNASALIDAQGKAFAAYRQPDPGAASNIDSLLAPMGGHGAEPSGGRASGSRGKRPSALKRGGSSPFGMMGPGMMGSGMMGSGSMPVPGMP